MGHVGHVIDGVEIEGLRCETEADHEWVKGEIVTRRKPSELGKYHGAGYVGKRYQRLVCRRCGNTKREPID